MRVGYTVVMETGKPRRWFQLHLSTCVIMMFVASGLVWLNVRANSNPQFEGNTIDYLDGYGWPLYYYYASNGKFTIVDLAFAVVEYGLVLNEILWKAVCFNGIVSLFVLITTACCCEFLLRRTAVPIGNCKL